MKWFEETVDDDDEGLQQLKQKLTKSATLTAMFFIATIMIVYGINNAYTIIFVNDDDSWVRLVNTAMSLFQSMGLVDSTIPEVHISRFLRIPGTVFFVIGGLLIIFDSRRNFIRSVGLYALCMGTTRIITYYPLIVGDAGPVTWVGWVLVFFACNLIYSGYCMLSGTVRGKIGLMISSTCLSFMYMMMIGLYIWIIEIMGDLYETKDIVEMLFPLVVSFVMYFILIILMDTDEIRYGDKMSRHVRILNNIDKTYRSVENLVISADDARALAGSGYEGWK